MCLLQDEKIDVACITETWLTGQANYTTSTIKSYGFDIIHSCRSNSRGGGTAVIFHQSLNYGVVNLGDVRCHSFEYIAGSLKCATDMTLLIITLYRTGPINAYFFEELDEFLSSASLKSDYMILAGDFNIHMENFDSYSTQLLQITESYGLKQIVEQPTHSSGGVIDLIFDNSNLLSLTSLSINNTCNWSDHFPISFSTKRFDISRKTEKVIKTRNMKTINSEDLAFDLLDLTNTFELGETFEHSCKNLFDGTLEILNNHAPLLTKKISFMDHAPWFDSEYKDLRKLRRRAEKKRHRSDENQILYEELRAETTEMATLKKKQYYSSLLDKNQHDVKMIYQIVNKELDKKQKSQLPLSDDLSALSTNLNLYFNEKIQKIRKQFLSLIHI